MNNLITKINHWADERNLKQADPKIQWMRITEEVGEIHRAASSVEGCYR